MELDQVLICHSMILAYIYVYRTSNATVVRNMVAASG